MRTTHIRDTELCYIRRELVRTCANCECECANAPRTLCECVRTRRGTFANPSRICANPSRTCENLRESANPSRIRELVANPRICCESAANPSNPLRTCANPVENFRESVANLCESAQPWWRTFANASRICANLCKIVANMCQMRVVLTSRHPFASCHSVLLHSYGPGHRTVYSAE